MPSALKAVSILLSFAAVTQAQENTQAAMNAVWEKAEERKNVVLDTKSEYTGLG